MPYDPERHGPKRLVGPGFHDNVRAVVRRVPEGWVTTYGDIGAALGSRGIARQVGFAMSSRHAGEEFPWYRVVSSAGKVSPRADGAPSDEQIALLRAEGVEVRDSGRIAEFDDRRIPVEEISAEA